jgi:hypothetical protein
MNLKVIVFIASLLFISVGMSHADELVARVYGKAIHRSDISFSKEEIERLKKSKTEKELKETLEKVESLRLSKLVFDGAYSFVLGGNSYEPTEQEIQSILKALPEAKEITDLKSKMTTDQRKAYEESRYKMAHQTVRTWKINKRLYEKYGGRIIFQQAGLEPIDAYRIFITEIIKSGKVEIISADFKSILSPPIINESQRFLSEKDTKNAFDKPWWEKKK